MRKSRGVATGVSTDEHSTVHGAGCLSLVAYTLLAWASQRLQSKELLLTLLGCLVVAWALAVWALLKLSVEGAITSTRWIWFYGVAFRLLGLCALPILEDDHYRYLWDGRQFALHGSPYGIAPAASFGSREIDAQFENILNHINHPQVATVYSPASQLLFLGSYLIRPGSLWVLKGLLIGADLLAVGILRKRIDHRGLIFWLWCPLLIQETAFSAHPDAFGLIGLSIALLAAGKNPVLSGFGLALSASVRPFALILLPLILDARWRASLVAFVTTAAAFHVPFLIHSGVDATAGLQTFANLWEFNSAVYAVLSWAVTEATARRVWPLGFLLFYGFLLWWWIQRRSPATPAQIRPGEWFLGLLFVFSPVINPWYLQWMIPFVASRRAPWSVAALMMVSLAYITRDNLGLDGDEFAHPEWVRLVEFGTIALAGWAGGAGRLARAKG